MADGDLEAALTTALRLEGLPCRVAHSEADLMRAFEHRGPGLTLRLRETVGQALDDTPVLMLAAVEDLPRRDDPLVSEWLVRPISESFLRARLRAWSLRSPCRWQRARPPADEQRRLRRMGELGLLDTEREERFDRLTRIASGSSRAMGWPPARPPLIWPSAPMRSPRSRICWWRTPGSMTASRTTRWCWGSRASASTRAHP